MDTRTLHPVVPPVLLAAAGTFLLAVLGTGETPLLAVAASTVLAALPLLLALPAVTAAAQRRWADDRGRLPVPLATAVTAPVAAVAVAVAARTVGQVSGAVGPAPVAVGIAGDTLIALVALVPLAAVLAVWPRRPVRRSRRGRAALVLASTLSVVGATMLSTSLPASAAAPVDPVTKCLTGAATAKKAFNLTALDVDIPINRFGQHDPKGKMYAPTAKIGAIRAEEKSRQVSIGLRDDPIQSLTIRANEGDCVEITYTNSATGGDFGVHIDGLEFAVASSGDSIGSNPSSAVPTGSSRTFRFAVPNDPRMEGAHYIHPGPGYRAAVDHGLFGALVIEPPGSTYWNSSKPDVALTSGWEAVVVPAGKAAFRENVLAHHEIGNDNETIIDKFGQPLPQVDDTTGSYRPGAFALNYRSEPFRNRLLAFPKEKSHAYSSATFGDPATPMMRGYLSDPTKIRLLHAGGEKFHIFHLHGGGDRWRYNPVADTTYDYADTGLRKDPSTQLSPSQRLDSQSIGPGESYNLEIEGGAGGVQQAAGDFLFHCHIAKHYVSGMWSFWRVFDTLQPDLVALPNRNAPPAPVDSTQLIGRTFGGTTITAANLDAWIRPQLPPSGIPRNDQDPTVWNFKTATANPLLYLGAPADPTVFPDSAKVVPGEPNLQLIDTGNVLEDHRPKILFDPSNGRPAYPMFRTKIGKRPPFTPAGHSGAPWLGQNADQPAANPADPWAGRADGLCPSGRNLRTFNVVAIGKPIQRTPTVTDPDGKIFVLAHDKAATYANQRESDPLAIRANQGDCIGITLTSEIPDKSAFDGVSKTTMHIHHVQFDPQGSDGVSAGFAFEHSVRPYQAYDPTLLDAADAGATTIHLSDVTKFVGVDANGRPTQPFLAVGEGTEGIDIAQVASVDAAAKTITLKAPLHNAHPAGEFAGDEFIQYRWYPDVVLDNIFWHDHVDGIHGWGHGLVGQLIIEPKGSTYHDPKTGAEVDSGTLVDIRTPNPLAPGLVEGSFRELALWTIDDNDQSAYSTLNLRANPLGPDPLAPPGAARTDPAHQFSSYTYGDPRTPLPTLYPDDPLVVRTLNVSPTIDTLHVQGGKTVLEPRFQQNGQPAGTLIDTVHYGVSEKFTLVFNGKQPDMRMAPGDYLYANGDQRRIQQGAWGIVRVLPGTVPDLQPLPGIDPPAAAYTLPVSPLGTAPPAADLSATPCVAGANTRRFDVTAADAKGVFKGGGTAFLPTPDVDAVKRGFKKAEPLVMHVAAGDCVTVTVHNARTVPVSFSAGKLDRTAASGGVDIGYAPEQNVAPGGVRDYTFFVPSDRVGTAAIADLAGSPELKAGLYGAVVVAPNGATFADTVVAGTRKDIGSQVLVHVPSPPVGTPGDYRDFTAIMADDDERIGQDFMPYPTNADVGKSLINYQAAPPGDGPGAFLNPGPVPALTSYAGDPVVVHVLDAPGSENAHVFGLGGLSWPNDVHKPNANWVSAQGMGPWESFDAWINGGAGGQRQQVGDYFYGDLRRPFTQVGMWGLQRVLPVPPLGGPCPVQRVNGGC